MEGALDAAATNGDAGLLSTETALHEHAGGEIERVLQRGGTAGFVFFRSGDARTTGRGGGDLLTTCFEGGNSFGRILRGGDDDLGKGFGCGGGLLGFNEPGG